MNKRCENTLNTALGINYSHMGFDFLEATMPVNEATIQPLGMLNGGASLALVESLGSMAANLTLDRQAFVAVGQSVSGFHLNLYLKGIQLQERQLHCISADQANCGRWK